jgi:CubicO group peptidase (beta-lactamase class C family)
MNKPATPILIVLLSLAWPPVFLIATQPGAEAQPMTVSQGLDQTIPNTPAGVQLAGFLEAFNTGDTNLMRRFVAEHFDKTSLAKQSADEQAKGIAPAYALTRGLTLRSITRSTDYEISALVQSKLTESWWGLTIPVSAAPPHGIIDWFMGPATPPADAFPREKLSDSEIVNRLEAYMNKLVAAKVFSGNVLVARKGKPIFERAYGMSNSGAGAPNRIETQFELASMGKMFTAVAIAQLALGGKLSLSKPIIQYLPDYPNKEAAEKITVHHLLTHTSGLGDFIEKLGRKENASLNANVRASKDYFALFANDPLAFEPGQKQAYSNAGFIVLGAVIEKLSGLTFADYVREHILKPASMNHTSPGSAAGGGKSTVGDLLKFDVALRRHKLLNARYTNLILTPMVGNFAYGFETKQVKGKRVAGKGGEDFTSISTAFEMYLDSGYTVIVLSNFNPAAGVAGGPLGSSNVTGKLEELLP